MILALFDTTRAKEDQMSGQLTEAVMAFKNTGTGWEELHERICVFTYEFPVKWSNWTEDECSDFFLFFMPKIKGIVTRYQPFYSFETYLSCTIRWNMRTFAEKKNAENRYLAWTVEESERKTRELRSEDPMISGEFHDLMDTGTAGEGCPFEIDERGRLADPAFRRRLLFVVLLRIADIPEDRIHALAELAGVKIEWLEEKAKSAKALVASKVEKREKLLLRRNECWYHLNGARIRSQHDGETDPEVRSMREKKVRTWSKRYATACDSLRRLNVTPSHEQLGELMDVPPGTVSSGLFFVRKVWKTMESDGSVPKRLRPKPRGTIRRDRPRHAGIEAGDSADSYD
jgi:hypothetical protein